MKVLYFDCFSGISGDMFLGSLIDLGVPQELVEKGIKSLELDGLELEFGNTIKNGISARTFKATVFNQDANNYGFTKHEHEDKHERDFENSHEHGHKHEHYENIQVDLHHGRTFSHIKQMIEGSILTDEAKKYAIDIFRIIADAEGKIHGEKPENVHFHEVGAYDSIADILGAAIAIDWVKPDKVMFSKLPLTRGFVKCNHGIIPLPAPATAEILIDVPTIWEEFGFEMVTPTGAAIAKSLGSEFGLPPKGSIMKTGYGAGKKTYERPNVLRAMLIDTLEDRNVKENHETDETPDEVLELEMNIDDMTGEAIGYLLQRSFEQGALDAWATPIYMKKSRPAYKLSFLIKAENLNKFTEFLFKNTSTFGFRIAEKSRKVLERSFEKVQLEGGEVKIKIGKLGNETIRISPEFEDCKRLAEITGKTIEEIIREVDKLKIPFYTS